MELAGLAYSTKYSEIVEIDICLEELNTMVPVKSFCNLKVLHLCNTKISAIDGLSALYGLEELYLSENQIQVMENLENLTKLKRLNLSTNRIQILENIENLVSLEWFWINENLITRVEHVEKLKNLNEFSIARNLVYEISNNLVQSSGIKVLNLSGNPICSFSEVKKLTLMENLENLSLADPNFGDCTICSLTNYTVFILFILKKIKVLDQTLITPELRNTAEATFLKKKLFYTMKIKTLKRAVNSLMKNLMEEALKKMGDNWKVVLDRLVDTKEIEVEIDERAFGKRNANLFTFTDQNIYQNPLDLKPDLDSYLHSLHSTQIQSIKEDYQKLCRFYRILNCMSNKIQLWSQNMIQEIEIEFEAGGNLRFEEGSITDSWYRSCCELVNTRQGDGMKATVTRVARIHNRLLRTRFEEKLESLVDTNENVYKRNIDYLFYSSDDLMDVVINGFKTPLDYSKIGKPACIPLSYSLDTAETDRVRKMDQEFEDVHEIYWPQGKVLLCKVYFGKGKGDLRVPYYGEHLSPREIWDLCPFNQPNICWAVYRTFEFDIKQRVWFLFDNTVILPEYLIEFEYSAEGFQEKNLKIELPLEVLNKTLNAFCGEVIEPINESKLESLMPKRNLIQPVTSTNLYQFKIGEYLNLINCNLASIDFICFSMKLNTLVLSCNKIESVSPLSYLTELQKLDLSFNKIHKLEGLESLENLQELDIHNNLIKSLAELKKLPKNLTKISCFLNNFYLDPRYDEVILALFPNLVILDWRNISKQSKNFQVPEIDLNHLAIIERFQDFKGFEAFYRLEILDLSKIFLCSVKGIELCLSLQKLNLSGNILSHVGSLDGLENLEELDLSQNFIETIESLPFKLKVLDLCSNKISDIRFISNLNELNHLCIDSNEISTVGEIRSSTNLIELYISNNLIKDIKEVLSLKCLSFLVIFDCMSNPCVDPARHRLHLLFYFSSLKVLNGANVEPAEFLAARQEYGGALTEDLLEKRCTGIKTSDLRQLDLSSCKLRSIEAMFTSELFPRLLELTLSNNQFNNFTMFGYMPMLAKVDLSFNKLDSFQYLSKIQMPLPNVEILNISHNSLTSLLGLPQIHLRSLRILNLSHNMLNRVDYLECLQNLREIDLSHNKLRIIDRKLELSNLRSANFENNGLKNLNFLEGLLWLQAIRGQNNRISDLTDIEKIQSLPNLLELYLSPNPIERKAGYRTGTIRKFPSLVFLDGKQVTEDERIEQIEIKKPLHSGLQKMTTRIASITLDSYFLKVHPRTAGTLNRKN